MNIQPLNNNSVSRLYRITVSPNENLLLNLETIIDQHVGFNYGFKVVDRGEQSIDVEVWLD